MIIIVILIIINIHVYIYILIYIYIIVIIILLLLLYYYFFVRIIIIIIIIIVFMFKSLGCTFDLLHHLLHTGAKQSWRATAGIRRLLQAVNPYEHPMILHFESFWYILQSDYFWLRMLDI